MDVGESIRTLNRGSESGCRVISLVRRSYQNRTARSVACGRGLCMVRGQQQNHSARFACSGARTVLGMAGKAERFPSERVLRVWRPVAVLRALPDGLDSRTIAETNRNRSCLRFIAREEQGIVKQKTRTEQKLDGFTSICCFEWCWKKESRTNKTPTKNRPSRAASVMPCKT